MSKGSNDRKSAFLGMPHGTASNRLRKQILFKYICKAGDNFCHKCGAEIEKVDDLSIEHVKPWEGRSVELFWDLDNIAFSHIDCNRPHVFGGKQKFVSPEGMSYCRVCKTHKPVDRFSPRKDSFNKLAYWCKDCR